MAKISNPTLHQAYSHELVSIDKVAAATGIREATLRVWESRGKIARMPIAGGVPLYHLPTVQAVALATPSQFTPRDPAANARGPHRSQAVAAQAA